jgi:hypothetical protein
MKTRKKRKPARATKTTFRFSLDVTTFAYQLGVPVKDVVTGFAGIITGRVQYLTGCTQYLVQPRGLVAGKAQESHWIDEGKLQRVKGSKVALAPAPNGGPQQHEPAKH